MKYIRYNESGMFLFPDYMEHKHFHEAIQPRLLIKTDAPASAGFVEMAPEGEIFCSGQSISLNVKANVQEDSHRINSILMETGT